MRGTTRTPEHDTARLGVARAPDTQGPAVWRTRQQASPSHGSAAQAAQVLRAMGYMRVASMARGRTRWRDAGYPVVRGRQLRGAQLERYSRHFLRHHMGEQSQGNRLDARVLLVRGGGLGSPVAL
jgi:hypothetical protein